MDVYRSASKHGIADEPNGSHRTLLDRRAVRATALLGAMAVCSMLVAPTMAGAAGRSSGPESSASASVKKNVKKLNKQVTGLKRQLGALEGEQGTIDQQLGALEGEQGGSRPPSGPAGGDLTGNYPNPGIDESSLGTVPSAAEAANAGTLDGLDSTAFGYGITSATFDPDETGTRFVPGLGTSFPTPSADESSVQLATAGAPLVARNLRVQVNGLPGNGKVWTVTLRDDGQNTALSCSIVGAIFSAICQNNGSSAPINQGSRLSLQVTPVSGPSPATRMDVAFSYGPA